MQQIREDHEEQYQHDAWTSDTSDGQAKYQERHHCEDIMMVRKEKWMMSKKLRH